MTSTANSVKVAQAGMDVLESFARPLAEQDARLADFFGAIEDGDLVLRLVYALDGDSEYLILEWPMSDHEYPGLSDIAPAAFVEECEIFEQFGAKPEGTKALNRVVVPPHAGHDFPRLGTPPRHEGRLPHAPHYVSGEAFEFPFGPVRAVGQESLYVGIVTSGEEVIDLYLLQWHKHRGIERRLRGLTPQRALFVVERAEGLSAVGNAWAFCRAAEEISGTALSPHVDRSRAIALELERLYNHAAAMAALCQATGLSVAQAQAEIALEQFLRVNLAAFGHRYLFGVIAIGGVSRAPDIAAIQAMMPSAYGELRRVIESLWSTNSFMDRLEACGIVTRETARRLGLVGPVARASGIAFDTRRHHPFGPYVDRAIEVPVRSTGDVMARMEVMSTEAEESVRLVTEFMGEGVGDDIAEVPKTQGRALGWTETPRGESLVWLDLDDDGLVTRARLRPGSVRNWRAFDDAARSGNVFTDIPIIEASFWLTVAGFAR
jgi:Ni,Fe-hydrogenase III large subunit/Ni,Fe-hydrogenase III component G